LDLSDPDFRAFHYDLAPAIPSGLLVVWAERETVHAAWIGEGGAIAWNRQWPTLSSGPGFFHNPASSITINGDRDALVVWYRFANGGNTFLAQRISLRDGAPVWAAPVMLGDAPTFGFVITEKVPLSKAADGSVEAGLRRGKIDDYYGDRSVRYRVKIGADVQISRVVAPPGE